jgi:hypothetical protein
MARSSEVVPASDDANGTTGGKTDAREVQRSGAPRSMVSPVHDVVHETMYTVSRAAMLTGRRWRLAVRWIGLLIFIFGASLLGFVFLEAVHSFQRLSAPNYLQARINQIAGTGAGWETRLLTASISVLGGEVLRLLYLLLLGILGSLISAKGIHFFSASESVIDEAVVGGVDDREA